MTTPSQTQNWNFDIEQAALTLRYLANPTRLRIALHLLNGEQSVAQLEATLHIRQPNLSQQLAELRDAKVVSARRDSRAMIYHLADEAQHRLIAALSNGFGGTTITTVRARAAQTPLPNRNHAAHFAIIRA
jgi:DNA-binding transcriptional ArsR family regulator